MVDQTARYNFEEYISSFLLGSLFLRQNPFNFKSRLKR